MKNFPKYSVLMSVYAKEKPEFLCESMMSMFEQTAPTDDFVLICDGPLNDELDAVISEMQEKFGKVLNVVRLSENHGLGHALNVGVTKCKNELIARMDSDDVSMKDRCEKELKIFEEMDVDVVGTNIVEYDDKMGKTLGARKVPELDVEIKKYVKWRNPMNHMSVMFKKTKVLETGNYLDMPGFEDYYLWTRMIKKGCGFYNIRESLIKVRGGKEMTSRRSGIKYVKQIVNFEKVLQKNKVVNKMEAFCGAAVRSMVALVPNFLRNIVYVKALRGRQ